MVKGQVEPLIFSLYQAKIVNQKTNSCVELKWLVLPSKIWLNTSVLLLWKNKQTKNRSLDCGQWRLSTIKLITQLLYGPYWNRSTWPLALGMQLVIWWMHSFPSLSIKRVKGSSQLNGKDRIHSISWPRLANPPATSHRTLIFWIFYGTSF